MGQRICKVDDCDEPVNSLGWCGTHYMRYRRTGNPLTVTRKYDRRPVPVRFWSQVDKSGDCWVWTGTCEKDSYGIFGVTVEGYHYALAHRFSYWLATGQHPKGLMVCHHCDNPPCVRPEHLFLGSAADNNEDMKMKGRQRPAQGDNHWARRLPERVKRGDDAANLKITNVQVAEIRERYAAGGVSQQALADEYGVSSSLIGHIVNNKRRGRT